MTQKPQETQEKSPLLEKKRESSKSWQTVVWNDPVNLMSYVTYVFRTYFGYNEDHATRLMLRVHNDGSAVVSEGARELMELHVEAMHGYGLWATIRESQ